MFGWPTKCSVNTHMVLYMLGMATHVCHFCSLNVAFNRSISLFSPRSLQQNLLSRVSRLLDISIQAGDNLHLYLC